jgi:hypothetical protein
MADITKLYLLNTSVDANTFDFGRTNIQYTDDTGGSPVSRQMRPIDIVTTENVGEIVSPIVNAATESAVTSVNLSQNPTIITLIVLIAQLRVQYALVVYGAGSSQYNSCRSSYEKVLYNSGYTLSPEARSDLEALTDNYLRYVGYTE